MPRDFVEKKIPRRSFSKMSAAAPVPSLLRVQKESYRACLQADTPPKERKNVGLQHAFNAVFPIESGPGHTYLEFKSYRLGEPHFDVRECKERELTYQAPLHAWINIVFLDKNKRPREVKGEEIYMGEVPLMTEAGSFVINGIERVVVSQLHRSPGAFFQHDSGRIALSGKKIYSARVIPYHGNWLDFEFDSRDLLYFRINRRRKMLAPILLKALDYSDEEILCEFFTPDSFRLGDAVDGGSFRLRPETLQGMQFPFEVVDKEGVVLVAKNSRVKKADLRKIEESGLQWHKADDDFICQSPIIGAGRRLRRPVYDEEGERLAAANAEITPELLETLRARGVEEIETIYTNEINCGQYMSASMTGDVQRLDREACRTAIYRVLRPGDPPNPETVNSFFERLFFDVDRYSLSTVGRMKLNRRLTMKYRVVATQIPSGRKAAEALKSASLVAERQAANGARATRENIETKEEAEKICAALQAAEIHARVEKQLRPAMEYRVVATQTPRGREAAETMKNALLAQNHVADMPAADNFVEMMRLVSDGARMDSPRAVCENIETKEEADKVCAALEAAEVRARVEEQLTLSREDILAVVKTLVNLRNGIEPPDDVDSLANRRVRAVGEFVHNYFRLGLERVQRAIRDRLSRAEAEGLMPHDLVSAKAISAAIGEFFSGNQLSQFMDQINALSEITHKRRVSALGAGGLTRERAGFDVRDVHATHYGRLCPIETPEGPNIGLINSMALFAGVNEYGFLETPYRRVVDGRVTDEVAQLSAIDESGHVIAQAKSELSADGAFVDKLVSARRDGAIEMVSPKEVDYMDVSPAQIASAAASMVPLLEHDDANRALMGSNMQRQAVPCLRPEKPLVGTGVERKVAVDSLTVVVAARGGVIDDVDAARIVIRARESEITADGDFGVDIYPLIKCERSNQNTIVNQRPIVRAGDEVAAGDIIADSACTDLGDLSLGQNVLVAFMPWNGYNFEDSILISERVVSDERFSSIHVIEEIAKARDTKLGVEEITRDIPNLSERALASLDDSGIVQIGTEVHPGDILVGKVTPKSEQQPTPDERLMLAVFGEKAADVKDTSLRMPPGSSGTVIDVKVFTAEGVERGSRAEEIAKEEFDAFCKDLEDTFRIIEQSTIARVRGLAVGKVAAAAAGDQIRRGEKITAAAFDSLSRAVSLRVRVANEDADAEIERLAERLSDIRKKQERERKTKHKKLHQGHELSQGVLTMVKVYIAIKRNLSVGDKMAGRHGNKGVVSRIVPEEDMPYLADGRAVDIVLSPLGVPSRMNVGQILEAGLGLAAKGLGDRIGDLLRKERAVQIVELRAFLERVYGGEKSVVGGRDFDSLTDEELLDMARHLSAGVPFATPIFDGASEAGIREMLGLAGAPASGQAILRDGRSGDPFSRPVTIGYMYMLKLHHLVDEKLHARSTGPYSLVTQQPLGGKARKGGQRLGEMEVWAIEAYGAANVLSEMLTIKSDDTAGRSDAYEKVVEEGDIRMEDVETPESFNVLIREIRALGLDADFE